VSKQSKGTALVTGASSGIGAVYADRLASRGYDLILVARNRDRLNALANAISDKTGRSVEVLVADLNSQEELHQVETVLRTDESITLLVNNAGFGSASPLVESDIEKMEEMISLNVTALTRLTYAVAPGLVRRGGGTIINIASIVGFRPEILNGVYGGTKAFVLAFSQSLRHELADKNIQIQVVCPGATATEFWPLAGVPADYLPNEIVMSAEGMVDASLAGLDQGEFVTIPALEDANDWDQYEAARQSLTREKISRKQPATRYKLEVKSAASA